MSTSRSRERQGGAHFTPDSTPIICSLYVLPMGADNASVRGQPAAILASPLRELTGFCLAVDCLTPGCRGERAFAIGDLAKFYGPQRTVAGRVAAAWLTTGPIMNAGVRPRRTDPRP